MTDDGTTYTSDITWHLKITCATTNGNKVNVTLKSVFGSIAIEQLPLRYSVAVDEAKKTTSLKSLVADFLVRIPERSWADAVPIVTVRGVQWLLERQEIGDTEYPWAVVIRLDKPGTFNLNFMRACTSAMAVIDNQNRNASLLHNSLVPVMRYLDRGAPQ